MLDVCELEIKKKKNKICKEFIDCFIFYWIFYLYVFSMLLYKF